MSSTQIEIRPYRLGDADDLYAAVRESIPEVSPWLPWCHADYSTDDAREWVESRMDYAREGIEHAFSIRDGDGRFLGGCGLNCIQPMHNMANLGYWVRTSATGRGLATSAVAKLAAFAFEETELVRLEIVCAVDNRPSQRVAEKSGALREAVLHDRLWGAAGPKDAVLYALLRSGRHLPGGAGGATDP